jgi:hypothetical protein
VLSCRPSLVEAKRQDVQANTAAQLRDLFVGLDNLLGLHTDVEFLALPRLVHVLHCAEAFPRLVVAFNCVDSARLGSNSGPDACGDLVSCALRG